MPLPLNREIEIRLLLGEVQHSSDPEELRVEELAYAGPPVSVDLVDGVELGSIPGIEVGAAIEDDFGVGVDVDELVGVFRSGSIGDGHAGAEDFVEFSWRGEV